MENLYKSIKLNIKKKDFVYALQLCNTGLEIEINDTLLFYKAYLLGETGELKESIEIYKNLVNKNKIEYLKGITRVIEKKIETEKNYSYEEIKYFKLLGLYYYDIKDVEKYKETIKQFMQFYFSFYASGSVNAKEYIKELECIKEEVKYELIEEFYEFEKNKFEEACEEILREQNIYKDRLAEIRMNTYADSGMIYCLEELNKIEELVLFKIGYFYVKCANLPNLEKNEILNDIECINKLIEKCKELKNKDVLMLYKYDYGLEEIKNLECINGNFIVDQLLFSKTLFIKKAFEHKNNIKEIETLLNYFERMSIKKPEKRNIFLKCFFMKYLYESNLYEECIKFKLSYFNEEALFCYLSSFNILRKWKRNYKKIKRISKKENLFYLNANGNIMEIKDILTERIKIQVSLCYAIVGCIDEAESFLTGVSETSESLCVKGILMHKHNILKNKFSCKCVACIKIKGNKNTTDETETKDILLKSLSLDNTNILTLTFLSDISSELEESLSYCMSVYALNKKEERNILKISKILFKLGRTEESIYALENNAFESFKYYKRLGTLYLHKKDFLNSYICMKKAYTLKKDYYVGLVLSDMLFRDNKVMYALNVLEEIKSLKRTFLLFIKKSQIYNSMNQYDESLSEIYAIRKFKLNLSKKKNYIKKELIYYEALKSINGKLTEYKRSGTPLSSKDMKMHKKILSFKFVSFKKLVDRILRQSNEISFPLTQMKKITVSKNEEFCIYAASMFYRNNYLLQSKNILKYALTLHNNTHYKTYAFLALIYFKEKNFNRASEMIDKALSSEFDNCLVWGVKALICLSIDFENVLGCINNFISYYDPLYSNLFIYIVINYLKKGSIDDIKEINTILSLTHSPTNKEFINFRRFILFLKKEYKIEKKESLFITFDSEIEPLILQEENLSFIEEYFFL